MPRLIWSPKALADVDWLHGFLTQKDRDAARRAVATIRAGVRILARHPEIGRPAEDMPPEFREWPMRFGAGGYVAFYRYDGDVVVVLAVRHSREAGY